MTTARHVVFGSRGSALALVQTEVVMADFLRRFPACTGEIKTIRSKGDAVVDRPIAKIGSKGVFTKEIETALLAGEIDVAVHSLKDLPTDMPRGLTLAAVPVRANPYDAYLSRDGAALTELPHGACVGTSSARRHLQLQAYRPDLTFRDIRGNVQTRINKMRDGQYDAIILAMAGLRRLGLAYAMTHPMPPMVMLPAVGQGALGIQCRSDDAGLLKQLAALTDAETWDAVHAERALLQGLGGGCQTPVGVETFITEDRLELRAVICVPETGAVYRTEENGPRNEADALGRRAAAALLAQMHAGDGANARELAGKRIVMTRAREQAGKLAEALETHGAEVIALPCIATEAIHDGKPLPDPDTVDWLVFTSVNGVRHFVTRLEQDGMTLQDYAACDFCAIGPATAAALTARGLTVSLTPPDYVAEVLMQTLETIDDGLAGKHFLLPRGNLARDFLPEALRKAGAKVHECIAYETVAQPIDRETVEAMLAAAPDAVTFTSASTVYAFRDNLDDAQWARLRRHATLFAIGPKTHEALADIGVPDALQATQYDIPGLLDRLLQWAQTHET